MKLISCLIALVALAACSGKNPLSPQSGGKPYEVLLCGDCDSILYKALSEKTEGLPQDEPTFDVSLTDNNHFGTLERLARNIVKTDIDPGKYPSSRIRYEQNRYAEPQLIIHVESPSAQALKAASTTIAEKLKKLLIRSEMQLEVKRQEEKRNMKVEKIIQEQFGSRMLIPADMKVAKQEKGFLWLSTRTAKYVMNIAIYQGCNRDSMMKRNIKGDTDDIYMTTVKGSTSVQKTADNSGRRIVTRGLWAMEGDAMGGPFVSHTIQNMKTGQVLTAEAFIYAPGESKRNKMRQLEALLYTFTTNTNEYE